MHILTCLTFMAIFYGVCIFGICCDGGAQRVKNLYCDFSFWEKIALRVAVVFVVSFVFYWAKQDRFIYYWDYAFYWTTSISRMNYIFEHSFGECFLSLWNSINVQDYSDVLQSVIALPMKLFGYTRISYVIYNYVLFFVPTMLVQGLIATKIVSKSGIRLPIAYIIAVFAAAFFQANYYAGLHNLIDIGYLLPMSVAMYLFIDYDFKRISLSRNIAISLCLILAWIARRYTIYFIIGFVVAMLIKAFAVMILDKRIWKTITADFLIIGGCSLSIFLILFRDFFLHALLTDYGFMYSAYDAPLSQKVAEVLATFGGSTFVIIAIVGILCFLNKVNRVQFVCMCSMMIAESMMFWRVQSMGIHHRMILNLPIFICFIMLLDFWKGKNGKVHIRNIIIIGCALLQLLNFSSAFIPEFQINRKGSFFAERYYPYRRNDLEAISELDEKLNLLTAGTSDCIYTAASSGVICDSILQCVNEPYQQRAVPNMIDGSHVDLRDGFPTAFLEAKYVVAATPTQTHLLTGQEVVIYLSESVRDKSTCIGRHFEKIYEIGLDDGVVAEIYEKISDFTNDDLAEIRNHFNNLYPGQTELFDDRIR